MRVLLTGAAGFIGSAIARDLAQAGHEVVALDALLPDVHPGPPPELPVPLVVGDVRRASDLPLAGVDAVCHQAAKVGLGVSMADAPDYASHNDLGTAVVLAEMARAGVRRLVLASSMVVYGEGGYACPVDGPQAAPPRAGADLDAGRFEPPCPVCGGPLAAQLVGEDAPLDPRNVYAATKTAQEHLAASWARAVGGSVAALRYHNVYGPRMPKDTPYAGVASLFRSALARGEAPRVFEDGGQRRDFVHVSDIARANRLALELPYPPALLRAYNIGSGTVTTVGQMAGLLAGAFGGPSPVVTGQYRLGDVRHITASSQRAAAELGYRAQVDPAAGLAGFASEPLRGEPAAAGPR